MPETFMERRLRDALHAPIAADPHARDRIMARVREAAASSESLSIRTERLRSRYSIAGLAFAAGIGSVAMAGSLEALSPAARSLSPISISSAAAERRYAIAVDMTRFVPDPAAARLRGDDGRVYVLLHPIRVSD